MTHGRKWLSSGLGVEDAHDTPDPGVVASRSSEDSSLLSGMVTAKMLPGRMLWKEHMWDYIIQTTLQKTWMLMGFCAQTMWCSTESQGLRRLGSRKRWQSWSRE
jgi:hypothetical protein